ncbi:MAG TPA: hypothetical protein VNK26_00460 [Pyrinomonadaceae bacterium]|nr:hypothetical protein [Pyrinomonadaceae bacterium]
MKTKVKAILITVLGFILSMAVSAQKGVDTQTEKIKDEATRSSSRETDAVRSFDWGKGKTKLRQRLPNPYRLAGRRDAIIESVKELIRERGMIMDEASSRPSDGLIITQPYIFAKGPVMAQSELTRYAILNFGDNSYSRGRYTLIIEVQSIDGVQNNVSVNAKVEGKSGSGLGSEWINLQSSGLAEDDFLKLLVEKVTGQSLDPVQDTDKSNQR